MINHNRIQHSRSRSQKPLHFLSHFFSKNLHKFYIVLHQFIILMHNWSCWKWNLEESKLIQGLSQEASTMASWISEQIVHNQHMNLASSTSTSIIEFLFWHFKAWYARIHNCSQIKVSFRIQWFMKLIDDLDRSLRVGNSAIRFTDFGWEMREIHGFEVSYMIMFCFDSF